MKVLFSVQLSSEIALQQLLDGLRASGLKATCSFDLQSARSALIDPSSCPCPHHGTSDCNCQYAVLLISDETRNPISLIVHGQDNQTLISSASPITSQTQSILQSIFRRANPKLIVSLPGD
jgi:hypothetical protein